METCWGIHIEYEDILENPYILSGDTGESMEELELIGGIHVGNGDILRNS